jgi:hypothetical protein
MRTTEALGAASVAAALSLTSTGCGSVTVLSRPVGPAPENVVRVDLVGTWRDPPGAAFTLSAPPASVGCRPQTALVSRRNPRRPGPGRGPGHGALVDTPGEGSVEPTLDHPPGETSGGPYGTDLGIVGLPGDETLYRG